MSSFHRSCFAALRQPTSTDKYPHDLTHLQKSEDTVPVIDPSSNTSLCSRIPTLLRLKLLHVVPEFGLNSLGQREVILILLQVLAESSFGRS